MEKNALLPDRCVKSNVPTERRLKRRLSWHEPTLMLLLFLCGPLVFIIVALIVRQSATIQIGLSDEWFEKRRRATLIGWGLVLFSIAMFLVGVSLAGKGDTGVILMIGSAVLGFGGAIYGLTTARLVFPKRITKTHVWLNGVCKEFLETLPEWVHPGT